MLAKISSKFSIRRRRSYLFRIIVIILCICLLFQLKNSFDNYSLSKNIFLTVSIDRNVSFENTVLNCSGDPLNQWCKSEVKLCDRYLIVYNSLFAVIRFVILQPHFAKGERIGGENMQDVLNQPEKNEYFQFEKEFIQIPCNVHKLNGILDNGHILDILSSATTYRIYPNSEIINETTIAVNRQDYVNFYHTMTDLYTVYLLCRFFHRDPKAVRILFLDAHPKGKLDMLWSQLFHSYTRLGHLKNISSIFYKELILSQPQTKSEIDVRQRRRVAPSFFFDFREHVLKQFNTSYQTNLQLNCKSLNIFFLVRHNYVAHPRNPTGKITRQLPNEKEVVDDLRAKFSSYSNINFSINYFEELSMQEQLNIVVQSDIFVGMHGAGLTHVLFLKPNRALIELEDIHLLEIHFEIMASINNINYDLCSVFDDAPRTAQTIFNCIRKKLFEMCPSLTR